METEFFVENAPAGGCDCCRMESENIPESYGCGDRKTVFTPREQEILGRIREASEKARGLRKRIEQFGLEASGIEAGELERLRKLRAELEQERLAAAEERMRFLGHA